MVFYDNEELLGVQMQTYADSDIPQEENHEVLAAGMDDWELPNQVVTLESL